MVHIHSGISAIKSIEPGTFIVIWMDPESVTWRKRKSEREK